MKSHPSESDWKADVDGVSALEPETDEQPVSRIQGQLAIGSCYISGIQETASSSFSNDVTEVTGRRQVHILVYPPKRVLEGYPRSC